MLPKKCNLETCFQANLLHKYLVDRSYSAESLILHPLNPRDHHPDVSFLRRISDGVGGSLGSDSCMIAPPISKIRWAMDMRVETLGSNWVTSPEKDPRLQFARNNQFWRI